MPKLSQERLEARRDGILDAAGRCFAEYGYTGATLARLEEATGLSRGGIFNYFDSKRDLFSQLARREHTRLVELALKEGFDTVARSIEDVDAAWIGVYVETWQQLRTDPSLLEQATQRAPEDERFLNWVRERQSAGELRDDVNPVDLARFMAVVVDGLVLRRSLGLPVAADAVLQLVHSGIDA